MCTERQAPVNSGARLKKSREGKEILEVWELKNCAYTSTISSIYRKQVIERLHTPCCKFLIRTMSAQNSSSEWKNPPWKQ